MEGVQRKRHDETSHNRVRLPKSFLPQRYDIKIYLDFKNLEYEFKYHIEMEVKEENKKMLIMNANLQNYEINKITLARFDHISDHYSQPVEGKYMTDTQIAQIFSEENIKAQYDLLRKEMVNLSLEEKLEKIYEVVQKTESKDSSELSHFHKDFFKYEEFGLISHLENETPLRITDESIYIPLNKELNQSLKKGDFLKVYFEVKGKVLLSSTKACGLYFSIFGNDAKLLENKNDFMKVWLDEEKNENLVKNAVMCALNEPVECRTYMPAFDEPCFKSKFKVEISVDRKYAQLTNFFKVLSNGDEYDRSLDNVLDRCTYHFSESPLMSIYLFTFVVGNYEYLESMTGPTRLRVYTPVGKQIEGSFAMETAKKALEFYQNYFKIPYSFPKIDLVPVPEMDYRAMENWGCIVYLNYALLAHKFLDIKERKSIARTNTHELSHMWFGNLVTMEWWDDIWLNEGFARFMEFECINEIKPEFEIWSKYIELIYQTALDIDERPTTHPVRGNIPCPREISNIFDTISYAKGASIIRMLSFYVGKDNFRTAIINYLEKYQYQNTKTHNLWDTFKAVLGIDVEPIMDSWLNLSGHPALNVELNSGSNEIVIQQSPFPSNFNKGNDNPLWKIPLFIRTKEKEYIFLMEEKEYKINIKEKFNISYEDLLSKNNFIKVNCDMQGFYRVFYKSDILLNTMLNPKNNSQLTHFDIAGLLSDYFSVNNITTCLNILDAIKPITNYIVLFYAMKIYNWIKEVSFQFTSFHDLLVLENMYKDKYEKHVNIQNKVNNFYSSLINVDKELLKEKIYLRDSSAYMNEQEDEFHELALHIYTMIQKDQDLIHYIVGNFEKYHPILHKNFKYLTYSCVNNYTYSVLNDLDKEDKLNEQLIFEYTDNFYSFSLTGRTYFRNAMMNLADASDKLINKFNSKLHEDYHFQSLYFKNVNPFKMYPNNRKKFVDCYIRMLKDRYLIETEYEEMTWKEVFMAGHCRIAYNELPLLFGDIHDKDLRQVIINYIIKELKAIDPNADNSDEQFAVISKLNHPNEAYCKKARETTTQVLEYFKTTN